MYMLETDFPAGVFSHNFIQIRLLLSLFSHGRSLQSHFLSSVLHNVLLMVFGFSSH